jgi:cytoskeletal protein CcmA (bactofilin family)
MKPNKDVPVTIFARDFNLKGDIVTLGDLRIEGKVDGSILCSGKVIIDNYAEVIGPIKAKWIDLMGFCKGDIYATLGVNLGSKSVLEGDVLTKSINIDKDAVVEGFIKLEKFLPELDIDESKVKSKKNNYISNISKTALNLNEFFKKTKNETGFKGKELKSNSDDSGTGGGWF